jgi:tRNA(Ile)-lysidine synthetase-like protein
MKYVVAVSGGVDSMVLLDKMVRAGAGELVVAHFDHGIRDDSFIDAAFVRQVAEGHGLVFETLREVLGPQASEALARERRYAFLRDVAKKHNAQIVTAHHIDDLVETVAINLTRGTGWRGLAALDSDITRPLIDTEKATLIDYANKRKLAWREDSTNADSQYLRNRLRQKTPGISEDEKRELRALHAHQKALKREIRREARNLIGQGPFYSRYFFTHLQTPVALECLRELTDGKLTRPQLNRLLTAIKVAKPNTTFEAGLGIRLHFNTRQFSL